LDEYDYITGDIVVLNDNGKPILEINELKLQRLGQKKEIDLSDWFYRIDWQETEAQEVPAEISEDERGSWLIFCDASGLGQSLAEKLRSLQEQVTFVLAGDDFEETDKDNLRIDAVNPEHYTKIIEKITTENDLPLKVSSIYGLWTLRTTI